MTLGGEHQPTTTPWGDGSEQHGIDLEDLLHPDEQLRFRRLCLATPLEEWSQLGGLVDLHLGQVRANAMPQTDVETAEQLALSLSKLLESGIAFDEAERSLVRGAVEYFVLEDDADSDLGDPTGFDDDVRVLNSVLDRINRPEFKVALG